MNESTDKPKVDLATLGNEFMDALSLLERTYNWIDHQKLHREVCRFLEAHRNTAVGEGREG